MDDSRIIDMYLARDQRAVELTGERYSAPLRSVAMNILGNRQDAEECENDAYLGAWNSIPPHEPRGYFFAYLARMVRHSAFDKLRAEGRLKRRAQIVELSAELEQCIQSPDSDDRRIESAELAAAVSAFLRTQRSEQRDVFIRRYWYCDTVTAVAKRYGMGESRVKSMLMRMRGRLKCYLVKKGYLL